MRISQLSADANDSLIIMMILAITVGFIPLTVFVAVLHAEQECKECCLFKKWCKTHISDSIDW